jgi:hypothetical protein
MQLKKAKMVRKKASSPAPRSAATKSDNGPSSGLGALNSDAVRSLLQDKHDLTVIARLKSELEEIERGLATFAQPDRKNAIKVLKSLHRVVSDLTTTTTGELHEAGQTVAIQYSSKSADLLVSVMGQLADLEYGRVGALLRPVGGGGNPFTFEENQLRNIALVLIRTLRQQTGDEKRKSLPVVYDIVAEALNRAGVRHRDQEIDADLLRSWWTYKPKNRKQNADLRFDDE